MKSDEGRYNHMNADSLLINVRAWLAKERRGAPTLDDIQALCDELELVRARNAELRDALEACVDAMDDPQVKVHAWDGAVLNGRVLLGEEIPSNG